jgi:hypothetical protein
MNEKKKYLGLETQLCLEPLPVSTWYGGDGSGGRRHRSCGEVVKLVVVVVGMLWLNVERVYVERTTFNDQQGHMISDFQLT